MARVRTPRRNLAAPPPPARTSSAAWWPAIAIAAAGGLAYANSLSGPFVFDDQLSVVENPSIRNPWLLRSVFSPARELPVAGRPLVNLSFALNYAIGGLGVTGYHIVNLACHLVCGLLVFGVVRRTLASPRLEPRVGTRSTSLAFAAALLWTLHPLNTEAVNYVTQRTELMMAACYLLTLYAAIVAGTSTRPWAWEWLAVVTCVAGAACKESMATAPLMVVLYDGIFRFDSIRQAVIRRWRFYAGLTVSWLVLAALLWTGPRIHSAGFSSGVSPWTYLLNQTVMIAAYLRRAVWPQSLVFNYGWPLPLTLTDVLPHALLVVSLLALTGVALVRRPAWGFLGAWFFVTLAPTTSLVPIATEVGAERRMYLPLVALTTLATVAVSLVGPARSRRVAAGVLVACSVALAGTTFMRNRDYRSAVVLARTTVDRHPTSVARHALGVELAKVGLKDEAVAQLRLALPGAPRAHYALGVELFAEGKTDDAIGQLEAFVEAEPLLLEAVSARQLLGQALAKRGEWLRAIDQYRMVLSMNPSESERVGTEVLLGQALQRTGNYGEAVLHYTRYLQVHPRDVPVLTGLGISLVAAERLPEGVAAFERAVEVDPDDGSSQRNLANALLDSRNASQAAVHAERAVALRPGDPGAYDVLGRALAILGRWTDARAALEHALRLDPADAESRDHLAALLRAAPRAELRSAPSP